MIGYGRDLPDDEAIGVAVGWWPCMPAPSGAYMQLNGDGSGDDRDRRAGERQRRGDGDADVRRPRSSAWSRTTSRSCIRTPTAANVGHGLVRLADDVQQRARGPRAPRPTSANSCSTPPPTNSRSTAEDLELVAGTVRVKGSPDRSVVDRRPRGRDGTIHGKGSGEVPDAPTGDTGGCVGRLGNETFLAPQLITQAAHVKVDRATGVVRVLKVAAAHDSGRILNRTGADGQVHRRRRDGRRARAQRGHDARRRGPAAEPGTCSTTSCVTCADAPEIEVDWIQTPTKDAGPRGSKGVGEPPQVPTAGAIANAISKVLGDPGAADCR